MANAVMAETNEIQGIVGTVEIQVIQKKATVIVDGKFAVSILEPAFYGIEGLNFQADQFIGRSFRQNQFLGLFFS